MLQYLLTWLAAPMRDTPGSSLAVGPDEDCSGQGCLVGLLEGTDWDSQLMPVALLLQGILLVTAGEHLLWQCIVDEPVQCGCWLLVHVIWDSHVLPIATVLQGILLVEAGEPVLWQLLADEPVAVGMVAGLVKL
jgi:hypothetical protein